VIKTEKPRFCYRPPPDHIISIDSSPDQVGKQPSHASLKGRYREDVRGSISERKVQKKIKMEAIPATVDLMSATRASSHLKAQEVMKKSQELVINAEVKRESRDARSSNLLPVTYKVAISVYG